MKILLIGLLTLTSISSYATTLYKCESKKGIIYLEDIEGQVSVDLSSYQEKEQYPLSFYLNDELKNITINKTDDIHEIQQDLTVTNSYIKIVVKEWDGGWGQNTLKIRLNKKTKKMKIKYYNTFLVLREKYLVDNLNCKSDKRIQ